MIDLPRHKCGLYLENNTHKDVYETIEQYTEAWNDCWISEEQKELAIKNNNYWKIQWYPDTPIGFYSLLGHDFDEVIKYACELQNKVDRKQ